MPVLPQPLSQLADRRRLAGAVDTDDEQNARVGAHVESRRVTQECRDLFRQCGVEIDQIRTSFEPPDELGRRRHADIGSDQRFLEPLPRSGVTWIERRRRELCSEGRAALRERVAKPREQTCTRGLGLGLRIVLSE